MYQGEDITIKLKGDSDTDLQSKDFIFNGTSLIEYKKS